MTSLGQCWGLSTPTAHKGSVRVDLKPQMKKIDFDGALLRLGFGGGVRVLVVAICQQTDTLTKQEVSARPQASSFSTTPFFFSYPLV